MRAVIYEGAGEVAVREVEDARIEEPTDAGRKEEEYVESRRRLGVSAESVWLVPKPRGGGMALVYLEALEPEWALRELAASKAHFDSWYSGVMRKLFGFDLARLAGAASGELLFAWCDGVQGECEASKKVMIRRPTSPKTGSMEHTEKGGPFESETDGRGDRG